MGVGLFYTCLWRERERERCTFKYLIILNSSEREKVQMSNGDRFNPFSLPFLFFSLVYESLIEVEEYNNEEK